MYNNSNQKHPHTERYRTGGEKYFRQAELSNQNNLINQQQQQQHQERQLQNSIKVQKITKQIDLKIQPQKSFINKLIQNSIDNIAEEITSLFNKNQQPKFQNNTEMNKKIPTFQRLYKDQVVQNKKIFQQIAIRDRQISNLKIQLFIAKDNKSYSKTENNPNNPSIKELERKIATLQDKLKQCQKSNENLRRQKKNAQSYRQYYQNLSNEYQSLLQKYNKCHKQREDLKQYINEAQIEEKKKVDKQKQKILKPNQKKVKVKQQLKKRMQSSSDKALSAFYERIQKAIQQKKQIKMSNKREQKRQTKIRGSNPKYFEQKHYKMIQEQSDEQTDQIQQYYELIELILKEAFKTQKQYLLKIQNYHIIQQFDLLKIQQLNKKLNDYDICKCNLKALSTENNQLKKQILIFKKQNEILIIKIKQTEQQYQWKQNKQFQQITELKNKNSAYQAKIKKLQQQLSLYSTKNQQKNNKNKIFKSIIFDQQDDQDHDNRLQQKIQQNNHQIERQYQNIQKYDELQEQKYNEFQAIFDKQLQQLRQTKIKQLNELLEKKIRQIQMLQAINQQLQNKIQQQNKNIQQLKQIKVYYESTMEDYVKRMKLLSDQIKMGDNQFENLTKAFKDVKAQTIRLQNHMKENMIQRNLSISKAQHHKLMKQQQLNIKQKQDQIADLKRELIQKSRHIQQLKQKQPSVNSIKNLKQQMQTLTHQIQALQRQNAQLKLQSLKKQQQKLKTNYQILQLKAEYNQQNNQYEHKKQSISSIRQSIIKQYIQHEKYSQFQLKQQNQNFDVMKVQLNEFVMMVEKLKIEKQAMVKELQLKDKQVKKLQQGAVIADYFNQKINQKMKLMKRKQIQMEEELSKCRDQLKQVQLTQVLMGLLKSMTKNYDIKQKQSQKDSQRIRNQQDPSSPTQQATNKNNKLSKIKQNLNKKQLKQNQSLLLKKQQQQRQSSVCNSAVLLEFLMTLQSKALELIRKLKRSNLEFSPGKSPQIQQKNNEGQNVGQKKLQNQLQEKMIKQLLQFSHRLQQQSNSFHLLIQTLTSIFSQLQTQITFSLQLLQQLHTNNKKLKKLASDQLQIITRNL